MILTHKSLPISGTYLEKPDLKFFTGKILKTLQIYRIQFAYYIGF